MEGKDNGTYLFIVYVAFISLGLPDVPLGVACPTVYTDIGVSVSTAGGNIVEVCRLGDFSWIT